jgi:hypothetical protein
MISSPGCTIRLTKASEIEFHALLLGNERQRGALRADDVGLEHRNCFRGKGTAPGSRYALSLRA